ncbi:putative transmembrane protein [Toxoplasma gondii CAST]|uniref:Putative transmembrane protein n=1 Tax=Toxoplasma gondii CAST TaxID=943122 RepID=A0A3R8BYF6_TOXGO|nr:putative transmembrane protein [Toxoplasma gondii CAST]
MARPTRGTLFLFFACLLIPLCFVAAHEAVSGVETESLSAAEGGGENTKTNDGSAEELAGDKDGDKVLSGRSSRTGRLAKQFSPALKNKSAVIGASALTALLLVFLTAVLLSSGGNGVLASPEKAQGSRIAGLNSKTVAGAAVLSAAAVAAVSYYLGAPEKLWSIVADSSS